MNTYYVLGSVPGTDLALFQGYPKVMARITPAPAPSPCEHVQVGRKETERGGQSQPEEESWERRERRGECRIQGQTSWSDDLENHFLFS